MPRCDHSYRVGNLITAASASNHDVSEMVLALIYVHVVDKKLGADRFATLMPAARRGDLCMEHWRETPCYPCARRQRERLRRVTPKMAQRVRRIYGDRCYYCGAFADEIDHVVPFARGGRTTEGNLVPACHRCNHGRSDLLLIEWAWRPVTRLAYRRARRPGSFLP